jgi:hypothetical protein
LRPHGKRVTVPSWPALIVLFATRLKTNASARNIAHYAMTITS